MSRQSLGQPQQSVDALDSLLDSHDNRLYRLEDGFNKLSAEILPALARLESATSAGFEKISERLDRGDKRFDEVEQGLKDIEKAAGEDTARDIARDIKLSELEAIEKDRKERKASIKKWVAGVAGTVMIAALMGWLGLK